VVARVTSAPEVKGLVDLVDEAFSRRSWHGTNLRGSLRGLTEADAAWRPGVGRHNIWEIAVHTAYWKYVLWRKLGGGKRGQFPLKGSDWFPCPDGSGRSWREDLRLLDEMHARLREAVAQLRPAALDRRTRGVFTTAGLVRGIAAHDLYHTGQIQLLKRMRRG
jgi:hypothetical protein